ncbi:MAG: hypothetical protein DMG50_11925 [Acidobacteria bacterium]|nr:MAG: hypothetical protein DMG50_11925 [Acidobacteriota bacterium]
MLSRTPLFTLLATSLLAAPSLEPPLLGALSSASEEIQNAAWFESLQNSNDDKYTLQGKVVNSLTGELIRGALVQIYFLGQTSMLTGPDGKFQFDGLPAGQTAITVRKPGFFTQEEIQPSAGGQRLATTGPNTSQVVLKLIPEGVIYGKISEDDGEPIEGLPIQLLVQRLQNGRKVWTIFFPQDRAAFPSLFLPNCQSRGRKVFPSHFIPAVPIWPRLRQSRSLREGGSK